MEKAAGGSLIGREFHYAAAARAHILRSHG